MTIFPLLDRVEVLREHGHQDEAIAAILGVSWTDLAAHIKDPAGTPLPLPDLEGKTLRLANNGGATVLSASAGSALTKDGVAVTVP